MNLAVLEGKAERGDFFLVEFDRFQGPLDLLLHLIRSQDIDIFDIPISTITKQFLRAIKDLEVSDLDGAGEFLEMAATLIRIKAQMLLPRPMDEEDEDPRAELVRRLLEHEQIREISQRMRVAEADRARRFGKGFIPPRPKAAKTDLPLETSWDEVFATALLVEMPTPERVHQISHRSTVSMQEKVVLILDTLKDNSRVEFNKLVFGFQDKMHGVMTFLAGLELTRRRVLFLRQTRPFQELWMYRRNDEAQEEPFPEELADDFGAPDEPSTELEPEEGVDA
ncbi:MAG: segregation/condensation protein A [Longimicrobiales bacterium]|nr:segregation/condensation protein A [Gemmatimonadales bacterium]MBT4915135.1 segregation/condensation protein A [Gemmatimonadales bacterium]MBT7694302.1 segregation/condensation protein A [Gemmatimonadales bacterium]MDG2241825.1 segregation/condensation protein A [Longimicrobiales bacterium]